jgi:hypothetical protein
MHGLKGRNPHSAYRLVAPCADVTIELATSRPSLSISHPSRPPMSRSRPAQHRPQHNSASDPPGPRYGRTRAHRHALEAGRLVPRLLTSGSIAPNSSGHPSICCGPTLNPALRSQQPASVVETGPLLRVEQVDALVAHIQRCGHRFA